MRTTFPFLVALLSTSWLPAQGADPAREVQEIARQIEEQLQEIDRLLLETSKKNQARASGKDLLQRARERTKVAEDGIDKLIEKLNQMKNQGGGSGSPDEPQNQDPQNQDQQQQGDQQQQPPNRQQRGGQQNRRENQTPDLVPRQPGEQGQQPQPGGQQPQPGGQQPGEQPQPSGAPEGGQEHQGPGENTRGNRQPEPDTGPGNPGTGDGNWGELQPYLNFLRNRGSNPPQIPEKFRKHWEAYLKATRGGANGEAPRPADPNAPGRR